jgi:hypothetical protein
MTRESYSWLPKSLGWIGNAANSNLLPRTLHFISKQQQQQQQQQQLKMSDSEDSLLDSAYEKLVDSSSTVGADLKKKKAPAVMKWPCITHIKVMPDGKKIITHPFLSNDNNLFDKLVITHLVVDEPFLAAYGAVAQAWTDVLCGQHEKGFGA